MNKDEAIEKLDDYIDGLLDECVHAEMNACIARHADVKAELETLQRIRSEARALPRSLEPERDLWPDIATRLADSHRTVDFGRYRRRRSRLPIARYLVAAAALVMFAFALPYMMERGSQELPPAPHAGNAVPERDTELERVAAQYLAARDELKNLLEQRKAEIAPETFAIVEDNLSVIASAVSEIELALAEEPQSPALERMLYAAYRSEVNLLRHAVQLSDVPLASNEADANKGESDAV